MTSERLTSSAPEAVSQKLTEFSTGKRHVAHAELQRHDKIHQPDDERHRHEEDHDRAVGGEDLIVVIGRQVPLRAADGHRLLRAHHDRVGEAAQQHDQRQEHIHDADALVIDAGQPFAPQIQATSP